MTKHFQNLHYITLQDHSKILLSCETQQYQIYTLHYTTGSYLTKQFITPHYQQSTEPDRNKILMGYETHQYQQRTTPYTTPHYLSSPYRTGLRFFNFPFNNFKTSELWSPVTDTLMFSRLHENLFQDIRINHIISDVDGELTRPILKHRSP